MLLNPNAHKLIAASLCLSTALVLSVASQSAAQEQPAATEEVTIEFIVEPTLSLVDAAVTSLPPEVNTDAINIYFTEAAREPSRYDRSPAGISRLAGLINRRGWNMFTLDWRSELPKDADLIIVAAPGQDLTADQVARLWLYIQNGGRVLILADAATTGYDTLTSNGGLFQLMWTDMGVRVRDDVLLSTTEPADFVNPDATAEPVDPEATEDPRQPLYYDFLTSNITAGHPITEGVDSLAFFSARSLEVDTGFQRVEVNPLVFTDDTEFYGETNFQLIQTEGRVEYNIGADNPSNRTPLATTIENPNGGRVVLIGDRDFAMNGRGMLTSPPNSASFVYPGNARFLMNTLTWLLDEPAEQLNLPTPAPTYTPTITPTVTPVPPTATPAS